MSLLNNGSMSYFLLNSFWLWFKIKIASLCWFEGVFLCEWVLAIIWIKIEYFITCHKIQKNILIENVDLKCINTFIVYFFIRCRSHVNLFATNHLWGFNTDDQIVDKNPVKVRLAFNGFAGPHLNLIDDHWQTRCCYNVEFIGNKSYQGMKWSGRNWRSALNALFVMPKQLNNDEHEKFSRKK